MRRVKQNPGVDALYTDEGSPEPQPRARWSAHIVCVFTSMCVTLFKQVVSPEQFLDEGSGLRLNGKYYITKVINPAIDRALALLGVDVTAWYNDMPRPAPRVTPKSAAAKRSMVVTAVGGGAASIAGRGSAWGYGQGGGGKGKRGAGGGGKRASVITNFFISDRCSLCGEQCARSVCGKCARCVGMIAYVA